MAKDIIKVTNDIGITDDDLMMIVMVVMMAAMMQQFMMPVAQAAQRYYTGQAYQGDVESKMLYASDTLQYWDLVNQSPYTPLISVFFINRGASRVYVAINAAQDWLEIWPGETRTVSHVGADKRIEMIFYHCDTGLTSVVEVEGHF
jgi:hypothetical protein